jgi:hypothetical protein
MKSSLVLILASLSCWQMAAGQEARKGGIGPEVLPPGPVAPTADLPSDESLAERREAGGSVNPKVLPRKSKGYGLAEFSQFLGFGETGAILPKGSILYCPDSLAAHVLSGPKRAMLGWPDFLAANRNWLITHEVSMAQVKGEVPISESDRASFKAAGKMVIATLRNNPVTVLVKTSVPPSKP